MLSIKGTWEDGVARPTKHIDGREGQTVIITFLEEDGASTPSPANDAAWDDLEQILTANAVATGIGDLAHQHDHYLHGTPKKA